MSATFTGEDIIVANTLSKSTLRGAAGWWAAAHERVHYFPSFEIAMNAQREVAWYQDGLHVHHKVVRHIVDLFTSYTFLRRRLSLGGQEPKPRQPDSPRVGVVVTTTRVLVQRPLFEKCE